jgi:hypothetical protein
MAAFFSFFDGVSTKRENISKPWCNKEECLHLRQKKKSNDQVILEMRK